MNFYSYLWNIHLKTYSKLKLKTSILNQNCLTKEHIENILELVSKLLIIGMNSLSVSISQSKRIRK